MEICVQIFMILCVGASVSVIVQTNNYGHHYYSNHHKTCPCDPVSIGCERFAFTSKCADRLPVLNESSITCQQSTNSCIPWWKGTRCFESRRAAIYLVGWILKERAAAIGKLFLLPQKRKKRMVDVCNARNTPTSNNVLRICTECQRITDLGPDTSPRYINEILCQANELCFSGEGVCIQQTVSIVVTTSGADRDYQMRSGCSCRLHPGSVLTALNQ